MTKHTTIIGIDLGDKHNQFCVLDNEAGEIEEEGRVKCDAKSMQRFFAARNPALIAMEAGTHSAWVSRLAAAEGHEVVVANPRKLRAIYENERKSDKMDAQMLARLVRADPKLLHAVQPRSAHTQADLALLKSRQAAVEARTKLINHARGIVKSFGARLPGCSTPSFHAKTLEAIPEELRAALEPVYEAIAKLTETIKTYDHRIKTMCESEGYETTVLLSSVPGVGPLTALAFVSVLEDPALFPTGRSVSAYLGLTPRKAQSGQRDPALRITKAGNPFLRKLLVGCAQYILGPFGPPGVLRDWGHKLIERGGRAAKKKAVIAVARKLAAILHRLWSTGELWRPFPDAPDDEACMAEDMA